MKKLLALLLIALQTQAFAAPTVIDGGYIRGQGNLFKNFAPNPFAEKNKTSGWTGSGLMDVQRDTDAADKLNGIASFELNPSAAENFTSTAMTLDNDVTGNCEARVQYKGNGTTWTFKILDGSDNTLTSVALTNESSFKWASLNYPCASGYKLRLSSSDGVNTINVGNFYWGAATNLTFGQNVGPWESYTPTGSWVANTTYTGRWRKNGDTLDAVIYVSLSGAPTSAALTVNLPNGYTIDTAKLPNAGEIPLGTVSILDAATGRSSGLVRYNNTTSVQVTYVDASGGENTSQQNVDQANPQTFASGDAIAIEFSVPISGWTSEMAVRPDTTAQSWSGIGSGFSGSTASASFADLGSIAGSITGSASNLTCSAASGQLGVTCAFPSAGRYEVCYNSHFSNTTNVTPAVVLTDGSNNTVVGFQQVTLATGYFGSAAGCGHYAASSSGSVTFKVRGTTPSGTLSVNLQSITIKNISQPMPAPLLVGSVTSSSSGLERVERAMMNGSCTTGTCALSSNTPGISSIVYSSTGVYTVNFAAGTWSAAPTCVCGSNIDANSMCTVTSASTTSASMKTYFTTPAYGNTAANIICMGPR